MVSGQCGFSAKVSTHETSYKDRRHRGEGRDPHVICVYNRRDFSDQDAIFELEDSIRRVGVKCRMTYKPDAFTHLGIYRDNKWKVRAIYLSK